MTASPPSSAGSVASWIGSGRRRRPPAAAASAGWSSWKSPSSTPPSRKAGHDLVRERLDPVEAVLRVTALAADHAVAQSRLGVGGDFVDDRGGQIGRAHVLYSVHYAQIVCK